MSERKGFRQPKKLTKKQLKKLKVSYDMVVIAELYNEKPDDPLFEKFSDKALVNIKLLAGTLNERRIKGEIK